VSGEARNDPRKYLIGWLVCRPGNRDAMIELVVPYVAACSREEGCVFFEPARGPDCFDFVGGR
jgi:quinol monooxygenase YgiN